MYQYTIKSIPLDYKVHVAPLTARCTVALAPVKSKKGNQPIKLAGSGWFGLSSLIE